MEIKKIKCDIMKSTFYFAIDEDGVTYQVEGIRSEIDVVVRENVEGVATTNWVQCGDRSETEERKFKPNQK